MEPVGQAAFVTTRWSVVFAAAGSSPQLCARSLEELCSLCWYPLYLFSRRLGHSPEDAEHPGCQLTAKQNSRSLGKQTPNKSLSTADVSVPSRGPSDCRVHQRSAVGPNLIFHRSIPIRPIRVIRAIHGYSSSNSPFATPHLRLQAASFDTIKTRSDTLTAL